MFKPCYWVLLIGILLLGFSDLAEGQSANSSLYVVTRNNYSEGTSTVRFGDLIMISIFPETVQPGSTTYPAGEHFALFTGGERRGDVTIDMVKPLACDSSAAIVSTEPSVKISGDTMGLATNLQNAPKTHANRQRAANAAEIAAASQVAVREFQKRGVLLASVDNIQGGRFTVTQIGNGSAKIIAGDFMFIEPNGVGHSMFVIASAGDAKSPPQWSRYDIFDASFPPGPGGFKHPVKFVDQLDFDRDGRDEIVIQAEGSESLEFLAIRFENGSWRQLWKGGQSGC